MNQNNIRSELARFLLFGVLNTLTSYLIYFLLLKYLDFILAYSVAYCIGIGSSYFFNVYFVFKRNASVTSFVRFPIVYIVQYCLGTGILWLLVDRFGIVPAIAMIGVIVVTIPVTFLTSRFVLKNER